MKKIPLASVLLILILGLAFILRVYRVTEVPPSLNWDEVSIGYNAYSILKTGKDEWGEVLPIHFKSYGEYKLPAQIYASIPAIAVFGLNDFSVRLTPVVYGTLTVLFLFFLARLLFHSEVIALISSILLAISPWHLQLTRGSFESSFSLMWVILGVWFMIKGFKDQKWWIVSMIPFAISIYTYNTARAFVPLFLFVILILYYKTFLKFKKQILIAGLLFAVFMIPLVQFVVSGEGSARYKLVSITDDPGLIPRINENRGNSSFPDPMPRLLHNKITYISFYFSINYLSHFSPDFLFISGAPHKQHHVQNIGQLYLFQAPFLLLGIYLLFKNKIKYKGILLSWVFLAFVPVSLTNDSIPHALRTLVAVPFYLLVSSFGFVKAFEYLKRKVPKNYLFISSILFGLIVSVSFTVYLKNFYQVYPYLYSRDWQYGNKQVVEYVIEHYNEYDQIVFSRHYGEPHMFTLFYMQYDPAKFQNDPNLVRFETFDWVRVLKFDKFYFPDLGDAGTRFEDIVSQNPGKKILFVGKSGDFPDEINKLKRISFLNGNEAFEIVEAK